MFIEKQRGGWGVESHAALHFQAMLGSLTHIPQRHSTGQCAPRLWCERMYTHFFSPLGSWCCHPLCSCINRPGVTCPADSTFDCNCAPWWLTAVSPGWYGWKCVKQEGDHILCFPLVCLYLRVSAHKSCFHIPQYVFKNYFMQMSF